MSKIFVRNLKNYIIWATHHMLKLTSHLLVTQINYVIWYVLSEFPNVNVCFVKITETENHLEATEEQLKISRQQCKELCFMAMSKVKVIYNTLCTGYCDSSDLIPDIGYRYCCSKTSKNILLTAIDVSFKSKCCFGMTLNFRSQNKSLDL